MANGDKLTTSKIESLRSIVEQLEREVTTLKNKNSISAASTVATSSGSGGSNIGAGFPSGQSLWIPTRVELKGWGVCRRIRETGITEDGARGLVSQVKALTPVVHQEKFD